MCVHACVRITPAHTYTHKHIDILQAFYKTFYKTFDNLFISNMSNFYNTGVLFKKSNVFK